MIAFTIRPQINKDYERLEERRGNTRIQLPSYPEFVSVLPVNQRQLLTPLCRRMKEHVPKAVRANS